MATNRNIALCIVFSIITCGIYGIYWFIKITDETNSLVSENQTASGGLAFLYSLLFLFLRELRTQALPVYGLH